MNKIHLIDKGQEEGRHGTPQFPFQAFSQEDLRGEYLVRYHWHDEVGFLYVTRGELLLRTAKGSRTLTAGHVYFINPGTAHGLFGKSPDSHHYALVFRPELLEFAQYDLCQNRYLEPVLTGKLQFPVGDGLDGDTSRQIGELIARAQQLYQNTDPDCPAALSIKIILLQIVEILFCKKAFVAPEAGPFYQDGEEYPLRPVFSYIQCHYREKITLQQLAGTIHMNRNYFCKYFREKVGKPPFVYLNEYRINQAAALLLRTEALVTEIAMNTGFDNMSYFIRQFKACKGCTPSAFRKMEHPQAVPIV